MKLMIVKMKSSIEGLEDKAAEISQKESKKARDKNRREAKNSKRTDPNCPSSKEQV